VPHRNGAGPVSTEIEIEAQNVVGTDKRAEQLSSQIPNTPQEQPPPSGWRSRLALIGRKAERRMVDGNGRG